jgi:hypothetical protein
MPCNASDEYQRAVVPGRGASLPLAAVLCVAAVCAPVAGYCGAVQQQGIQGLMLQRQQQQDRLQLGLKRYQRDIQNPPGSELQQHQRQLMDSQQRQQQLQLDRRQMQQLQQSASGLQGEPDAAGHARTQTMQQRFARERQQQQLRFEQQWQQPPYRAGGDSNSAAGQPLRAMPAPGRP